MWRTSSGSFLSLDNSSSRMPPSPLTGKTGCSLIRRIWGHFDISWPRLLSNKSN